MSTRFLLNKSWCPHQDLLKSYIRSTRRGWRLPTNTHLTCLKELHFDMNNELEMKSNKRDADEIN